MSAGFCSIIPPQILTRIAAYAPTPEERAAAHRAALISQALRDRRVTLAPIPGEPNEGEQRQIRDARGRETERGAIVRREDQGATTDQAVSHLYDGLGNVYRYYWEVHGRRSVDGAGMLMEASAHYGSKWDNAAWTGTSYVSGDGNYFNPLDRDLTVMGHEITHGVTQYTANLEYQDQAGALNEHVSDVFGALVEQYAYRQDAAQATWLIGQLLCEGKVQRGGSSGRFAALRDMLYPGDAYHDPVLGDDPQPADMSGYVKTSEDNGGVHINSGIPNRAFARAALERGGHSWETLGKVWYDVLTARARAGTNFQDWAAMTLASAEALFGAGSLESQAIIIGWTAVGLDPKGAPAPTPEPSPTSPCWPEFMALLRDPVALPHLQALARLDSVRRLAARVIPRRRS